MGSWFVILARFLKVFFIQRSRNQLCYCKVFWWLVNLRTVPMKASSLIDLGNLYIL